ncbi:MAG TPA: 3-isopropylmalate dehydratase small subunit [Anaerolineales bacterium]|nr:3-isopropylmalate dehydratase small subunit [Anaerolineales bacterium]
MEPFHTLTSHVIPLPNHDIDTDQIIPARYLKATDKEGLVSGLFADWRYQADGSLNPDFALNRPESQDAQILLAGDNFGCGSSREHAPWALVGWGIRAVISSSFADIFRNNALKNGLLPVAIGTAEHNRLFDLVAAGPYSQVTIDLAAQLLYLPDGSQINFPIDPFSKACLLDGLDQLGYLLQHQEQIAAYERQQALPVSNC